MSDLKLSGREMEIVSKVFQCFQSPDAMKVSQDGHSLTSICFVSWTSATSLFLRSSTPFRRALIPHSA